MEQTSKKIWGLSLGLVFLAFCLGVFVTYFIAGSPHPDRVVRGFIQFSTGCTALGILLSCFQLRWKLRKLPPLITSPKL